MILFFGSEFPATGPAMTTFPWICRNSFVTFAKPKQSKREQHLANHGLCDIGMVVHVWATPMAILAYLIGGQHMTVTLNTYKVGLWSTEPQGGLIVATCHIEASLLMAVRLKYTCLIVNIQIVAIGCISDLTNGSMRNLNPT